MKIIYKLSQKDIQEIIAEKYGVSVDKVMIEAYETTYGYGMCEHTVNYVRCEVEANP